MFLWELVKQYPHVLICLAGFIACFFVARKQSIAWLKEELLKAMLAAEKLAKKEVELRGWQLMNKVVTYIVVNFIPKLPCWSRLFINEDIAWKLAQKLYDGARDLMDDGKLNKSK